MNPSATRSVAPPEPGRKQSLRHDCSGGGLVRQRLIAEPQLILDESILDDLPPDPPLGPPRPPRPPRRPEDDEPPKPPKPLRLAVPVWKVLSDHLAMLMRNLTDELLTQQGGDRYGIPFEERMRDIEAEPLLAALGHLLRADRLLMLGRVDGEQFRPTEEVVDGEVRVYHADRAADDPSISVNQLAASRLEFVREAYWLYSEPGKGPGSAIWPWMERVRRRALEVRQMIGPVADAAAWRARAVALRGELIDRGFTVAFDDDGDVYVVDERSGGRVEP